MSIFETHRPLVFSVAYRMLGSVMEAEDIVQETYLRWVSAETQPTNPKAYLCKIATNLCLDHIKSAQTQREAYVGPWLPEPIVSDAPSQEETVMLADSLSFAFLVMLEQLSPTERAIFLLRQVYDFDYAAIASIVGKSEPNCRKLLSRAKRRIQVEPPQQSAEIKTQAIGQLFASMMAGDIAGMLSVLHPDVVAWSDGGGKVTAARKPIRGADHVAAFLKGLWRLQPKNMTTKPTEINGQPGVLIYSDGKLYSTIVFHIVEDKIKGAYSVLNPDKLRHITA